MRGINYNDLTTTSNKLKDYADNVNLDSNAISKQFTQVLNSYNGTDLNFLTDNLNYELMQLEKTKENDSNYIIAIDELIKSYQRENDRLTMEISSVTPQRDL